METPLYTALTDYQKKKYASFHTPGHKNTISFLKYNLYDLDFTELPDTDSLFEAEGCILKAEQAAAKAFSTLLCVLSAGGCTMCIQGMLRLAAPSGGKLVCGRIIHRSAVNTMALLGIDPVWVMPEPNAGEGLAGRITPEGVRKALEKNPEAKGVYLTSPDYYGVICDIQGIACVCKEYGVPLLVDNAHGAHLGYLSENLHPIHLGASMAACSAHKTLPVLTGGAWLQINDSRYLEGVKEAMSLFGSTSPSYPVMASLDLCRAWLEEEGQKAFQTLERRVGAVKKLAAAKGLGIPEGLTDPARITLNTAKIGLTGQKAAQGFRECGVEPEYSDDGFVVLIPSPFNTEEEFLRVERAIEAMPVGAPLAIGRRIPPVSGQAVSPRKAVLSPSEEVPMNLAVGRIAARASCPCPPGVPVVMPGEVISEKAAEFLIRYGFSSAKVLK